MTLSKIKQYYPYIYICFSILLTLCLFVGYLSPAFFCIAIVLHLLALLILDVFAMEFSVISSVVLMMIGSSVFSVGGGKEFLKVEQGFSGFAEPTLFTVASLYIVARGIQNSGILHIFLKAVLGNAATTRWMLMRLSVPLMTLSAFMNNTPIVAIFTPYVREWALKLNISPSKVLIPLSYITIFGGMVTLIGTSANLVIKGLVEKANTDIVIGFWTPLGVALPCAIVGVLYLITVGVKILPNHKDLLEDTKADLKSYIFVLEVTQDSYYHKRSIADSGLRGIKNCFLFEVRRGRETFTPVKNTFILRAGDLLYFKGNHDHVLDLVAQPGLRIPGQEESLIDSDAHYLEVSIATNSVLIGKTLDEVWFNRTYDATVLALHQNGEKVENNISKVPLKAGDTLVLLASRGFRHIWQNSNVFNFITPLREDLGKQGFFWFALLSLFFMILIPEIPHIPVLYSLIPWFPKIPLVLSTSFICCLFILFQLVDKNGMTKLVDWNVLLVIGAAFGLSHALEDSGAAKLISDTITDISGSQSPMLALMLVYIGANVLTEMITNNAAAAIFVPLSLATATTLGVSPMPFIMAVMMAASSSYSTPFGYQTNMMVYGPGNYKYLDYLKVGLPVNLIYFAVSMLIIPLLWKF